MFKEESAEEMRPSTGKSWVCRSTGQSEKSLTYWVLSGLGEVTGGSICLIRVSRP